MIDFESTLSRVVEFLETIQTPYMVTGGLANLVWGEPRTTAGMDTTVDIGEVGL